MQAVIFFAIGLVAGAALAVIIRLIMDGAFEERTIDDGKGW